MGEGGRGASVGKVALERRGWGGGRGGASVGKVALQSALGVPLI